MLSCKNVFILLILTLFLSSCADTEKSFSLQTRGWSVEKLYAEASKTLAKHDYPRAIKLYNVLELTYPYGVYAQQGMLDLAYAYYKNSQPELAIPVIDQFINIYPTNHNMDYALYLKGSIDYQNSDKLLFRYTGQDISERNLADLLNAYKTFERLTNEFPQSRFVSDARDKMNQIIILLAKSELYRARYYMAIKAYLAAIGRAQNLIVNFPNTSYVEEALAIQIAAYLNLGETSLSQDTKKVLAINFPKSKYLNKPWLYNDMSWYVFWR